MTAPALPGDPVYLGSFLTKTHWYGVVGDGETPAMQVMTMEAVFQDAVIAMDVLKGDKGDDGKPAEIVKLQYASPITQASQLPTLTDKKGFDRPLTLGDAGMAWWIGSLVYLWTGTNYITKQMGSQGQIGQTPHIDATVELLPPEGTSTVTRSGTDANPVLAFKIAAPRGLPGPAAAISLASDYDDTLPPEPGQVVTWNGLTNLWEPSDFATKQPRLYSVPSAYFENFNGFAQRHSVLAYTLEAQDYDYVPKVQGHIKVFGIEGDSDPLTIGCEVRMGDPATGQIVGRAFGQTTPWCQIMPHYSTPGDDTAAVTPDNGVATVKAGQTMTYYVNLYNDGIFGVYFFNKEGAQLIIEVVPQ